MKGGAKLVIIEKLGSYGFGFGLDVDAEFVTGDHHRLVDHRVVYCGVDLTLELFACDWLVEGRINGGLGGLGVGAVSSGGRDEFGECFCWCSDS